MKDNEASRLHEILKLLSNKTNFRIIELLSQKDSYPKKISREINKTEGVVVRALKSMENAGILESSWGVLDERPAKVYTIKPGILFLISDFASGKFQVLEIDKKYLAFIEKLLERDPNEFSDIKNFLKWKEKDVEAEEISYFLKVDEEEAKGFIDFVGDNLRSVFIVASYIKPIEPVPKIIQTRRTKSFSREKGIVYDISVMVINEGQSGEITVDVNLIAKKTGETRDSETETTYLGKGEQKTLSFTLDGEMGIEYEYKVRAYPATFYKG